MKKLFLFSVLLAVAGFTINAQTIYYVDNNQGSPLDIANHNYNNLQTAINTASAGDIIYVQPSPTSYGNITMPKTLTIYGIGYNPELNAGQYAYVGQIYFNGNASNSKISGLFIDDINLTPTTVLNENIVIQNNRIRIISGNSTVTQANNAVISGNFFYHDYWTAIDNYNSQNWLISNNTFYHNHPDGQYYFFNRFNNTTMFNNNIIKTSANGDTNQSISIFNACNGAQISNNIFLFTGNSVANMNRGGNSALVFNNNLTYSYTTTLDALGGTNIDDQDPLFVSFSSGNALNDLTNDFHFKIGSPAIGAGADGNDLGVYNGGFPFNLRGYPTELPYLTDFVIFNNILSEGTDLNINVKADANNN